MLLNRNIYGNKWKIGHCGWPLRESYTFNEPFSDILLAEQLISWRFTHCYGHKAYLDRRVQTSVVGRGHSGGTPGKKIWEERGLFIPVLDVVEHRSQALITWTHHEDRRVPASKQTQTANRRITTVKRSAFHRTLETTRAGIYAKPEEKKWWCPYNQFRSRGSHSRMDDSSFRGNLDACRQLTAHSIKKYKFEIVLAQYWSV